MATRRYNGQLYQAATSEFSLWTLDGFDFRLQTWEDLKLEYGAESKLVNNADGSPAGYTTEHVKTSASVKLRLDEMQEIEDQAAIVFPDMGILQVVFDFTVVYGNSINKIRKDTGQLKFNKSVRDLPKSQDPLMVDVPMLLLDFVSNARRPIMFPV